MLQACTGKLFTYEAAHTNLLRGILHTNMIIYHDDPIDIGTGVITQLSMRNHPNVISCEIIEKVESTRNGPGVLVSNSINIYQDDFADVISFFLGVICTPDSDLAKRLLSEGSRSSLTSPKKLISKIYDEKVHITLEQLADLRTFSTNLLALSRKKYLLAIKAIKIYVTAIHRLGDNLDLSYTLFVMSLEALVKDTIEYESTWSDVEEGKRNKLDSILASIDTKTAEKIRSSIVESEHLSISKKFNAFILNNIPENYFREDASLHASPIGMIDLKMAIHSLYELRSKFVHELKPLPKEFSHLQGPAEVQEIDGKLLLTFQGISRLARSIIKEFVFKQEKIAAEPADYSMENPNLLRMKLCPSHWISSTEGLNKNNCSTYLNNYINLLDKFYDEYPSGPIYDIGAVITKGFSIKGKLSIEQRTSIIVLATIFFNFVPTQYHPTIKISKADNILIDKPSVQTLIMAMIFEQNTEWSIEDHEQEFNSYYKSRLKASGFRLSNRLEACLGLAFSEKLRSAGEHERALAQLNSTADNFPSIKTIRELAENYSPDFQIDWHVQIYPNIGKVPPRATLECIGL